MANGIFVYNLRACHFGMVLAGIETLPMATRAFSEEPQSVERIP